jgi:hypothetical protein
VDLLHRTLSAKAAEFSASATADRQVSMDGERSFQNVRAISNG